MTSSPNLYENVALVYIGRVRKVSEAAAVVVERIHIEFGAHAALRVALIIKILILDIEQNEQGANIDSYAHLLEDYPAAIPLAQVALACCMKSWTAARMKTEGRSPRTGILSKVVRVP